MPRKRVLRPLSSRRIWSPTTPWEAAADGGIVVGRVSQKAAGATAGFFNQIRQEGCHFLLRLRVRIHLVNPSDLSFGTAVITPRWLYVLAAATPARYGDTAHRRRDARAFRPVVGQPGDVVGIGIHTANALRGYSLGQLAAARGAFVVFGGIHATLFPDEVRERGAAHAVVSGDGDLVWRAGACGLRVRSAARTLRRRADRWRPLPAGALGSDACRHATCGARCRPSAAVRSIARSVRCGGPMARSRGSAACQT